MSNKFYAYIAVSITLMLWSCTPAEDKLVLTSNDFFEPEINNNTTDFATSPPYVEDMQRTAESKNSAKTNSKKTKHTSQEVPIYTSDSKTSDSKALAQRMKKHIIAMVYPESYQNSQIKILQENTNGNQLELRLSVTWKDQWVTKPYVVEGLLRVERDGKNARFEITHKNTEAEALEMTYEHFKESITIPQL